MLVSLVHRLIWIFFRPLLNLFANQVILGQERVRQIEPPFIFVSNHESHFDPFIISDGVPYDLFSSKIIPIYFFTRDLFFEQPIFKHFLRLLGAFPGRIGHGLDEAALYPVGLLRQGTSIGIFPEWCFPSEPEASRMQLIAPHISRLSGRPIIPVFLFGIEDLRWSKIFLLRKRIIIAYGRPLWPNMADTVEEYASLVSRALLYTRLECIHYLRKEEERFWRSYARFYYYLELARPYARLKQAIAALLPERPRGRWLDLGTGAGAMVDLVLQKGDRREPSEIIAADFNAEMLALTRDRFAASPRVRVENVNLTALLPYRANAFDGVTANLVLPYITHFEGTVGRHALRRVLQEVFRVMKPGGFFLWSTPRKHVYFPIVALASWRSFFDRQHPEYRSYALNILRHALRIQAWGRREVYNFLSLTELELLLHEIGFRDLAFTTSLVGQVHVISCFKPRWPRG
ncbi:MAG: methyltransferase domain-containing protein [Candidatus Sungbacteria bacterium]|uniref:Methyltransferase domain-containing protein n=1 Tax=Candidatus Sungiibacteriota bacterium TaxID=2750080 RepID=A0A932YW75_9BACT|nr:methyltransferase domain-containing protein [Candidatus Sungbacteria bacterium]